MSEQLDAFVTINPFYTVEPVHKRVSKQEFIEFINHYPRRLDVDRWGVCEPPLLSYNDFALANRFPYSIVASTFVYDDAPSGYYYAPEESRMYTIVSNYEELYEGKTGYKAGDDE